jgi:antitoxin component YwqK of YwqJK toxin-antitoxin module
MKSIFLFSFITFYVLTSFGQTVVDVSKTQKATNNGIEIINFQGKPLSGFVTENYPNGQPKSWITLKDGIPNGLWQEWFENGKLKYNAYWKDGKGHGLWQYFHENGNLRYEESYILDIPNGISRQYYDNEQLKADFFWLQGKKQGVWTSYSETGVVLKTEIYDDDKLISTTEK